MPLILSLLIVAAGDGLDSVARHPDAVTLFRCQFDAPWDTNFDRWPDRWQRQRGAEFPWYVKIEITPEPSAQAGHCLQMQLDGGAAAVFSPPVPVDSLFSYVLEGRLKTLGLKHDAAYLTITFRDRQGAPCETITSERLCDVPDWRTLQIGPISPRRDDIDTAVVGLHLQPGTRQDLKGTVWFDAICLARLPRMALELSRALNVYDDPAEVRLTCQVWGVTERQPELSFELLDAYGQPVGAEQRRLEGAAIAARSTSESDSGPAAPAAGTAYGGRVVWNAPIPDYGYYQIRVTLRSAGRVVQQQVVSLAVRQPLAQSTDGEFGWTLPRGDQSVTLDDLAQLVPEAGVHWVKFPLWYRHGDRARGDRIMQFVHRLERSKVQVVGLLDRPPPDVLSQREDQQRLSAASVFSVDPSIWSPSLDPIMTRLSLRIRWWQLGGDHDRSFVGFPNLAATIRAIRSQLFRFGQQAHLGIGWDWLAEPPSEDAPPWDFVTFSAAPPLTGIELTTYLAGVDRVPGKHWVLVEPLPRDHYDLATRAQDLVLQMMSAKMARADAIFLPDPFDPEHGVLNADGTPGPLLLPWRTAALLLAGTTHLGTIRTSLGSQNQIFARGDHTVMVIWHERPAQEVIFLGHDIRQIDLWGRSTKPAQDGHRQVIDVGPLPTFLTGIDASVAQWRMALTLDRSQLPSVFGRPHANGIRIKNSFPQGVAGELRIVGPETLRIVPDRLRLKFAREEARTLPFDVALPMGASSGPQEIRLDFDLSAGRQHRFSVYRQIEIGLGQVEIQTSSRLDGDGTLVVEQQTKNNSDLKISFRFLMYAPNRRSQRRHVIDLERGQDLKTYRYPDGRTLVGQTLWLRAEEIDGPRIFNHRFVAQP